MHQIDMFTNTPRERGLNRGVNAGNEGVARGELRESPCEVPKRNRAGPMTTCDGEAGTPPSRGRGKRDTSRDAYAQVNLSQREEEVLRYVLAYPGRDWTRAELAKAMGWRDGPMCGRVNALVAKGRLIEGPARDCTVGKRGHAVRAA